MTTYCTEPYFHHGAALLASGLRDALNAKAGHDHEHTIADIMGSHAGERSLTEQLDGKADTMHSHSIEQVNSLKDTLYRKAAVDHVHEIAQVRSLLQPETPAACAEGTQTLHD